MKRIIVFLLAASLMLALCAATVGAKEGHALDLVISTPKSGNDEFAVTVTVENVKETLHVAEYVVTYDSEKLELVNSVDEDGVLDCITDLPKDWENFVSVEKEGSVKALALTAAMDGLKSGELKFEFRFRIKDGATGEAKIEISDESVLGAYVGKENDIKEFGGKGGSVAIVITEDGDVGEVSTDTVSVTETEESSDPEDEGGSLTTVLIIAGIAVVVIGAVAAAIVILKKKK